MCDVYQLPSPALYLLQPDQDLEGLLTQKHGVIVMKVKVEDLKGLGGSLNIQEYLLLLCSTL